MFALCVLVAATQRSTRAASNPALQVGMHLVEVQGESVRHHHHTATVKRINFRNIEQAFTLGFAHST